MSKNNFKEIEKITNQLGLSSEFERSFRKSVPRPIQLHHGDYEIARYLRSKKKESNDKLIKVRIDELNKMGSRKDIYQLEVDKFSDETNSLITSLTKVRSYDYREKMKIEHFKSKNYFKYISKVVLLVIKSLLTRRKYFLESWYNSVEYDPISDFAETEKMRATSIQNIHDSKSALTIDALNALSIHPENRDEYTIKKIIWLLSRFSAFEMIIPKDMVHELAKRVTYQKLENGRIIAHEGVAAKKLYYLVSGKINLVKRFDLSGGDLYKLIGHLNKGEYTDPVEIEKSLKRTSTMYSKGVSEVLMLESEDLKILRYNHYHLPVDFLNQLELFKTYPIDSLLAERDSIIYKYFGPNIIISEDSDHSPWIYIVKSGNVKVVKKMKVIKPQARIISIKNEANALSKLNKSPLQQKSFEINPEKSYELWNAIDTKPKIELKRNKTLHEFQTNAQKQALKIKQLERETTLPPIKIIPSITKTPDRTNRAYMSPSTHNKNFYEFDNFEKDNLIKSEYDFGLTSESVQIHNTNELVDDKTNVFNSKTEIYSNTNYGSKYRSTFIVIDVMKKEDMFGLHNLEQTASNHNEFFSIHNRLKPKSASNNKITLISDGSELLMISKRNFLKFADVDTLCKIEQVEKSQDKYMSEDQAREHFNKIEKWKVYKRTLFNSILNNQALKIF